MCDYSVGYSHTTQQVVAEHESLGAILSEALVNIMRYVVAPLIVSIEFLGWAEEQWAQ